MAHARPLFHAVTGEPLMPATWTVKGESFGPDVPNGADRLMARGADQTGILRGHWSAPTSASGPCSWAEQFAFTAEP